MKPLKLAIAVTAVLGGSIGSVQALELYVDAKTKQLFAEPGKGRVKLGTFEQVGDLASDKKAAKRSIQEVESSLDQKKTDLLALEARLDKKKDKMREVEKKIDTAAAAAPASTEKKWYDKLSIGGYTQFRYSQMLDSPDSDSHAGLADVNDGSVGNNKDFIIRRGRLKISGDLSDWISLYVQADFAAGLSGTTSNSSNATNSFVQLRDAYADIYFDKKKEFRIRPGQSKVPFGWENLQSSQNRVSFDRADALNAAGVRDERDIGIMAMWSPETAQQRFKYLVKSGLKGTGDYGVAAFGVFNGAGANRVEFNDNLYLAGRLTYPFELPANQMVEVGISGYTGRYFNNNQVAVTVNNPKGGTSSFIPTINGAQLAGNSKTQVGFQDQKGAIHAVLYPKPFGIQTEWSWGRGPELSADYKNIEIQPNFGGYVQAMYKIDHWYGTWIPYVKWETYNGNAKFDANSPRYKVNQLEAGVEWQPMPELELTLAYANMDRTNLGQANANQFSTNRNNTPYQNFNGNIMRAQLQWNY